MSQIEVPDWVVEIYRRTYRENFVDGRLMKVEERVHRALTAALGAWVVPEKFQVRTRCPFFGWGHWYSIKSQQERDDHFNRMNMGDWIAERRDLYDLRQEKPE